ncbi:hypothetical protein EV401DRAFT_2018848 [Pisolithus croceorrhizus]|nr:hypothetical protein EV401DRAFT_2018848 [Pisolithus croceorrhizus]
MGAVLIVRLPLFTFLPPVSSIFFVEPHLTYENCTLHVFHSCLHIANSVLLTVRVSGFHIPFVSGDFHSTLCLQSLYVQRLPSLQE